MYLSCSSTLLLSALDAGAGPLNYMSSTTFNAAVMLIFANKCYREIERWEKIVISFSSLLVLSVLN